MLEERRNRVTNGEAHPPGTSRRMRSQGGTGDKVSGPYQILSTRRWRRSVMPKGRPMRVCRLVSLILLLLIAMSSAVPAYAAHILGPECY
jgi:hypothetical protein